MKIMIVDDEPFVLTTLARQVRYLGYDDLLLYQRPLDALAILEGAPDAVDMMFCDLQMPELDGIELVRQLGRIRFGGALVLISGEDERILQAAQKLALAYRLDVLGRLQKPISLNNLRSLLAPRARPTLAPTVHDARKTYDAAALRDAIARGELMNVYQPKVELTTGALAGVETLVRWQHPTDGTVFPDQFIGIAEEHGLIGALTDAVLAGALRQARAWHQAGLRLHTAVNISMDSLGALDFPDAVTRTIDQTGAGGADLVLEVTESRLMKDPLAAMEVLTRLRLRRIRLSIDDFGTGHSSLAQLRDLPFDELKIDRGFVHGAHRDASLRVILEASLGMAHQLGMSAVAEGVEDREDWNLLCALGCDLAQGYFIARPMPAGQFPAWVCAWEERRGELTGQVSGG
jgi:EAL domain-containing protein (putative c-di-GMP-specific phosphodiesterase class I)/ActR/RegA family two-component response regulator